MLAMKLMTTALIVMILVMIVMLIPIVVTHTIEMGEGHVFEMCELILIIRSGYVVTECLDIPLSMPLRSLLVGLGTGNTESN